jgi:hypothetical protein
MTSKLPIICGILFASVLPAFGQTSRMRAVLRGGYSDHGKCTIEVDVDVAAQVEIFGDEARLRTLAGGPAQWRRFQCSGVMPRDPRDFRFSGIDGRGRQTLIAHPRDTGGVAVVQLEDPKGGREGYTFDIEWRGSSYGRDDHGDWNRRRDYQYRDREYRNRDYDNDDRDYDRYDNRYDPRWPRRY